MSLAERIAAVLTAAGYNDARTASVSAQAASGAFTVTEDAGATVAVSWRNASARDRASMLPKYAYALRRAGFRVDLRPSSGYLYVHAPARQQVGGAGLHFPLHVRFAHPDAGYPAEQRRAARFLKPGEVYGIRTLEIGQSDSHVTLYGFSLQERFSTVFFEPWWPPDDEEPADVPEPQDDSDPVFAHEAPYPGPGKPCPHGGGVYAPAFRCAACVQRDRELAAGQPET
jgi:hypothetical protein